MAVKHTQDRAGFFFSNGLRVGLFLLLTTLLASLIFALGFFRFSKLADQQRRMPLQEEAGLVRQVIQPVLDEFHAGRMDPVQARQAVLQAMRTLVREDASEDSHLFAHSLDGAELFRSRATQDERGSVHPFQDKQGHSHLQEVVQRLRIQPEGIFISCWLPNPRTGRREESLSFLRALPELGILIGTGNFASEALQSQRQLLTLGLPAGLLVLGLFSLPLFCSIRSQRKRSQWMEEEIQKRLKVEEALRRSEATLKAILDSAPIGIASLKNRHYLEVNEAFARIFQRAPSELRGQSTRMCYASDESFKATGSCFYDPAHPGEAVEIQDGKRADGSLVPLLLYAAPLDMQGATDEYVVIALDITERKRVEEDLTRSRLFADAIMDSIPVLLCVHDTEGKPIRWNRRSELVTGYSAEELYKIRMFDWFQDDEETTGRMAEGLRRLGQEGQAEAEATLTMKDGRRVPYHLMATKVDIGGKPCVVAVGLDLTESRRAEEKVRQSQEKFRIIFDASPFAITLHDPETGSYIDVNRHFCEALGLSKKEVIGRTTEQLGMIPEQAKKQEMLRILERGGTVNAMDVQVSLPGVGDRDILVTARTVTMTEKPFILAMTVDITERKRAERAIQESERKLHTLFEGSPIGVFRSTLDGRFLQVNPALAAMFRYADSMSMVEDVNKVGVPASLYEYPDQRAGLMQRLRANMGTWFVEEIHFRRSDHTFLDGIMSIVLDQDPGTGSPLLFGFVQDISARKQAEDDLKAKTALLEAQTNATLDGILVVDGQTKRILTNRRMIDLFHFPRHALESADDAQCLEHVVSLTKQVLPGKHEVMG